MGAQGTTVIDFDAAPGTNQMSISVTGQSSILSGSLVEAWISPTPTADHNLPEILLLSQHVGLVAHDIVAGTGFTITATTELRLTGQLSVNWVWN